jgi:hypothetical protein
VEGDVDDSDDEENAGGSPGEPLLFLQEPEGQRGETACMAKYKMLNSPLPISSVRNSMREMMALTFSSAPMMQMPKNLYFPLSIRDEEGTGDEEDLKGEIVVHIQNGEDAHYD